MVTLKRNLFIVVLLLLLNAAVVWAVRFTVMYIDLAQTVIVQHTFNPSPPGDAFIIGSRAADTVVDDLWVEGSTGLVSGATNYLASITAATCTGDANGGSLTINGSNQIVCSADSGGGTFGLEGNTRAAGCAPTGSTTGIACFGEVQSSTNIGVGSAATTTKGYTIGYSGTTIGDTGAGGVNGQAKFSTNRAIQFAADGQMGETTDTRFITGLFDNTIGNDTNGDDPAGIDGVWWRYSTAAGDTNWMCASKDGTTLATANSGVAVDTNRHLFEISINSAGTSATNTLDGTLRCTISTNMPVAGQILRWGMFVDDLVGGTDTMEWGWTWVKADF